MIDISQFALAKLLLAIATIGACLYWWNIEGFHTGSKTKGQFTARYNRTGQISTCLVTICAMGIIFYLVNRYSEWKILESHDDWLIPSSDPTPEGPCPTRKGELQLLLGHNAVYAIEYPAVVFAVGDNPKLILDRDSKGRISVTGDIYDAEDNEVVEIRDNHFTVANDVFKMDRPDKSTLLVTIKKRKEQVLRLRFINARTIDIQGIFRYPSISTLQVRNGELIAGKSAYRGSCIEIGHFSSFLDYDGGNWNVGRIRRYQWQ